MENFFKNLQKIGEVCAAVAEEIERNENRARQRVADEAFEEQLPRPSAPSYTDETIDEQLASLSSVSSGYGSGCSSSQSSRRSSNFSIDETWDVARYNPPAAAAPAPRDPPITPGQALLAAVAAGAVVAGAVYVGKALSAKEAVLVATFTECETISKKIKKFVNKNYLPSKKRIIIFFISEMHSNIQSWDLTVSGFNGERVARVWRFFSCGLLTAISR